MISGAAREPQFEEQVPDPSRRTIERLKDPSAHCRPAARRFYRHDGGVGEAQYSEDFSAEERSRIIRRD